MKKPTFNRIYFIIFVLLSFSSLHAQQATWIWYPGDYEIWLSNKMENRRTDRGSFFPVFWKVDNHYVLVDFHKDFNLAQPEEVSIYTEGKYNVKIDGRLQEGTPSKILVPAGKHRINVKVFCQEFVPAIYVKGNAVVSDSSWLVTFEDKEWIDETGKTSDVTATKWLKAGSWNFNRDVDRPSQFKLPVTPVLATTSSVKPNGVVYDFGKETFGFIKLHGIKGHGKITLYYGESLEEATSDDDAITMDELYFDKDVLLDSIMPLSKAFRYVRIKNDSSIRVMLATMLYEYNDLPNKGSFLCSDTLINRIYDVAKYTLHLNTREFFIDGIKRDRWVWSGDAYQSYLMNFYLMNDNASVKRTLYALRGKDPVTAHINTIMDYTFYWFLGIYDYYLYSADTSFIEQNYARMQSLMDYCMNRRNKNGLMEGLPGDWIFIDWANGLSKKGEVSFEQMLFCRSLETMALCAEIVHDKEHAVTYRKLAADLKKKLFSLYWNEQKHALVHSRVNGKQTSNVTRYANMFGIFFNYFTEKQKQDVRKYVLLNDSIQKITTPYMRFYELEALCAMGEQKHVLDEMKDYWGGMLKLGATSFWEEYDPSKSGAEHYAMYGREFGKSLCHAWGASPIYLLGKYYLGVKPLAPGYSKWIAEPNLGGLSYMTGLVPVPSGTIELYCNTEQVRIYSPVGTGIVRLRSSVKPTGVNFEAIQKEKNVYEVNIKEGVQYIIHYKAL